MILVVAIAVTATFYHHLEIDMRKSIRGFKSVLAWIHLVGMNVGGAATTLTMIFAGLIGSGILSVITSGAGILLLLLFLSYNQMLESWCNLFHLYLHLQAYLA